MPRPKIPLISRRKTLEVALEIIDDEGLDALSIRRIAEALNVNGASLYHHFENKEDILVGVAHLALADIRSPETHDEPWQVWMLRNTHRLHAALLKHPNLVPVILQRGPLGVGAEQLEESAAFLEEEGVPIGYIHVLLRGLEIIALGSVLEETQGGEGDVPITLRDQYPLLYQSSIDRRLTPAELFHALAVATIRMVDEAIAKDGRTASRVAPAKRVRTAKRVAPKRAAPAMPTATNRKSNVERPGQTKSVSTKRASPAPRGRSK